ncbi:hypothetical protein [Bradyrhizobium cenepequi]|uniref:hypothetical protein n=1 Tax=Bradyrhizobium cenepequi TaxID=2821403 RepID=UPI001CE2E0AF|nr:hypothetical protein [Bradyrhizobium cenepequi]MCA6109588.1 hypothetical protein [Bradyrhizobium cenepequi]
MIDSRNTTALIVAAAILALVLGFSYGATFNDGCTRLKDAPFGCLEWWFSRYQTLIAMFGAIVVAWLSVQPVLKQLRLSSLQTAVALQQVHSARERLLENSVESELNVLETLSADLSRGHYECQDDHAALPHWVWNMNQEVERVRDRLVQRQNKNPGGEEMAIARQGLIEILGRLSTCMSAYNGSVYLDADPEYEVTDEVRATIEAAELQAGKDLPGQIDAVSTGVGKLRDAFMADLGKLRTKRQLYDRTLADADLP